MGAMEVMEVRVATSSFTSLTLLTFPTRVTIDRFFNHRLSNIQVR